MIKKYFIVEPIVDLNETILGFELLTRFITKENKKLNPQHIIHSWSLEEKHLFLYKQCHIIHSKCKWFKKNDYFLSLNIDYDMAKILIKDDDLKTYIQAMPFIRLEISENFHCVNPSISNVLLHSLKKNHVHLWLDDLGAGNANTSCLVRGLYDVVKIDRCFFNKEIGKKTFPILINNIKKFCDKIVIEGVEDRKYLSQLQESNIWGLQGYLFQSIELDSIEYL